VNDLPTNPAERAVALQEMMVSVATGASRGAREERAYQELRRELMDQPETAPLLPPFVRTCRTLETFWGWIKGQSGQWEPRRVLIRQAFTGLLDHLEGRQQTPADIGISATLESFTEEGVHRAWSKALERRSDDPDGAITAARTLLETVCKSILDAAGAVYGENDDLPKLHFKTAELLNLAPSQHTEETFKSILGSCQNVVNSLGSLRNKIGDAHGQGRKPVRPSKRHAELAVNLAGAMATFLVQTYAEREKPSE
jgi:hypothetical protein